MVNLKELLNFKINITSSFLILLSILAIISIINGALAGHTIFTVVVEIVIMAFVIYSMLYFLHRDDETEIEKIERQIREQNM